LIMSLLLGQTALVTGASSGIGAAIAIALGAAGARVGVNFRSDCAGAENVAQKIRRGGSQALAIPADVAQSDDVRNMFEAVVAEFGRLDILIANAGIQQDGAVADLALEQWQNVIDVNLTGQFLCAQQAIRQFRCQEKSATSRARGKIICISSVHEVIPWAGHVNYAASKGGVMLMMKTLAQEVAHEGIRINAIAPGAIRTSINKDVWSDTSRSNELLKLIPYGRIGEPNDIARAAVWLASDEADYITGVSLLVDGGMSLYPEFRSSG
jgi:glucose 1-dehydrogenase